MTRASENVPPAPPKETASLTEPWRSPGPSEALGRVHVSRAGSGKRLRGVLRHLHGHLLFLYLGLRYRDVVGVARPMALYLERQLFPMLSESGCTSVDVCVDGDGGDLLVMGACSGEEFQLPRTQALAAVLHRAGVAALRLDTRLEYGQIVEAILTLLHASPYLTSAIPSAEDYPGWNARRVASAMRGNLGYHKFCSEMRYDTGSCTYSVTYSYCELFFSRAIRNYVERRSWYNDHRAMFYLSPRLAIIAGLLLLLPGIALDHASPWALALWVLFSLLAAAGLGLCLHALGALLYAQEHRDVLIDDYCLQIGRLSRFPETDPSVVVKLDRQGRPLYINPSARRLLGELYGEQGEVQRILPHDLGAILAECFREPRQTRETETDLGGKVLRYVLSPFADERSVIAVGSDVTYLKTIERELRDLNQNLERLVEERTAELRETQDVTILSLAALAEIRDPETGKHLQRTRDYVKALAEELRHHPRFRDVLDDHVIDHLHKSVPLHDVGKIGMPDAILLKPEKLTDEEYERMKQHTLLGGDALRWAEEKLGFDSFLRVARDIAYYHHEHWDGSGYPHGLKGDDIPWAARLMTLADFYDALTTERVYKDAFPHERVREDIVRQRGRKFDPDVVDAFLAIEDEFIRISQEFSE